jgi:hypothetical protein
MLMNLPRCVFWRRALAVVVVSMFEANNPTQAVTID